MDAVAASILATVILGLYYAFSLPINLDAAWLLHVSREVLDGKRLYTDIIEINPPLIIWLGIPVIVMERVTGVSHTALFPTLVGFGAVLSLMASYRLSRHVLDERSRTAFLLASALGLFVLPASEWGQREHIMLLLTVPYITACAARSRGIRPGHGWIIGLAAGLGFALKPHFMIAFIALEAWLLTRNRAVWSGTVVAAGVITAYGIVLIAFTQYLPLVLSLTDVYTAYGVTPVGRLVTDYRFLVALAALGFAAVRGEGQELLQVFGLATATWLVAPVLQGKGFGYHFTPGVTGAAYLVVLATQTVARRRLALGAAAMAALLIGVTPIIAAPPGKDPRWGEIREVRELVAGMPIVVLSPDLGVVWPHIGYSGAHWNAPVPCAWAMLSTERGQQLAVQWMTPSIAAGIPALVPIRAGRSALPGLLEDPMFREAWLEYASVARGEHYELFMTRR